MSVYLIATIEVRGSGFAEFTGAVAEIIPIVESVGWKLANAYRLRTGLLGTVIDVWELEDFNHLNIGMAAIASSPRFPQIQAVLQETIIKETLCLADALHYPVARG